MCLNVAVIIKTCKNGGVLLFEPRPTPGYWSRWSRPYLVHALSQAVDKALSERDGKGPICAEEAVRVDPDTAYTRQTFKAIFDNSTGGSSLLPFANSGLSEISFILAALAVTSRRNAETKSCFAMPNKSGPAAYESDGKKKSARSKTSSTTDV